MGKVAALAFAAEAAEAFFFLGSGGGVTAWILAVAFFASALSLMLPSLMPRVFLTVPLVGIFVLALVF